MDRENAQLLLHAPTLEGGERIMTTQLPQAIVGLPVDPQPVPGSNADGGEGDVTESPAPPATDNGEDNHNEGRQGE